jgi:ribonuclease HI
VGILFVWADEEGTEQRDAHVLAATAGATISQMELEAPSEALRIALRGRTPFDLAQFDKIVILSDSRYVCDNLPNARFVWPKTGWRTKDGPAVLNKRDWKTLKKLMERMYRDHHISVGIEWERGKVSANARAVDKLAKQSSASESFGRARPTNVRRKLTSASVERGSVRVHGQQLRVRIIEARHLSGREGLYRYEVVDPSSAYDTKVDFAESDQPLGPGHTYDVTMNAEQANPRIVAIIDEIEEDLTPYRDALRALGRPASATDIATGITRATGVALTPPVAKRRLDTLVTQGEVRVALATAGRRRFLYELLPVDDSQRALDPSAEASEGASATPGPRTRLGSD